MKINEITEGIVSGLAGGVKGLAKGLAGIPGAAIRGYKAGATPSITPPTGWKPGVSVPSSSAAQYTKDIASAIRTGAGGQIYTGGASPTQYSRAPIGTQINQWTKTGNGWTNTQNNTLATQSQSEMLDREWSKYEKSLTKQQPQTTIPTQPTPAPAVAPKSQGTIGALGKRGAGTAAAPYQSPLGITVRQASDAGIVLNYKNRNFMLNNRGEWSLEGKDTAGATASGQLQAEMDKVARSTGFM